MVLRYDGLNIARWHVDAAFGVHPDLKSHSGGTVLFSDSGGGFLEVQGPILSRQHYNLKPDIFHIRIPGTSGPRTRRGPTRDPRDPRGTRALGARVPDPVRNPVPGLGSRGAAGFREPLMGRALTDGALRDGAFQKGGQGI